MANVLSEEEVDIRPPKLKGLPEQQTVADVLQLGSRKKNSRWTVLEEDLLIKYHGLYPHNVAGLIHDYLPGRKKNEVYQKVFAMKRAGSWNKVNVRVAVSEGAPATVEKLVDRRVGLCEKCPHRLVCKWKCQVEAASMEGPQFSALVCRWRE